MPDTTDLRATAKMPDTTDLRATGRDQPPLLAPHEECDA